MSDATKPDATPYDETKPIVRVCYVCLQQGRVSAPDLTKVRASHGLCPEHGAIEHEKFARHVQKKKNAATDSGHAVKKGE